MPIISQMIFRGSRAETCWTKSQGPASSRSSTMPAAVRSTSCSNFWIIFGVNARDTIRRSRAWRGSSMLIMEPKYSFHSGGKSSRLTARLRYVGVRHEGVVTIAGRSGQWPLGHQETCWLAECAQPGEVGVTEVERLLPELDQRQVDT